MNRYRCAKVLVVVLPLLALTAAAATGLATVAWRAWGTAALLTWVGPGNVSAPAAQASTAPEPAPDASAQLAALETIVVIEEATSPPVQEPLRAEPEVVDYERLNSDVRLVTETLERFNQKLLRMIAQARAAQAQTEGDKSAGGPDQSAHQAEPAAVPGPAPQPKSGSGPSG